MPQTQVLFFQEASGTSLVHDWLRELRQREPKVFAKLVVRIRRLAEMGYELRRPEADTLRDGVYELRVRWKSVNYRILYFFHGQGVAVLTHGFTKERQVPDVEIDRALKMRDAFVQDAEAHTFYQEG